MELQLLGNKGLDFYKKRKKWALLCALFGASSYGVFRVCRLPSVTRKRRRLLKLVSDFFSLAELVSDSAETVGVVSRDLKEFLMSDSDEIPKSLRQISKIVRSDEFSDSLIRVSEALTVGIFRAYGSKMRNEGSVDNKGSTDKIVERIFSSEGTGFVSVVAGSFARNLVSGFYSNGEFAGISNGDVMCSGMKDGVELSSLPRWVNVMCDEKCKNLMADCIQVFVRTAVGVYLDKTLDINAFDEIFVGLTNPNHENKMRNILVSVCNGAVETFVKTSHNVLMSKSPNSNTHSILTEKQVSDEIKESGWSTIVSSTLSVPSNRRFVLDVTGRVTFETLRSVTELLRSKVSEGLKTRSYIVHDHVVDKGRQAIRYFGLKSYVFVTICFALLFHMINGTKALLPA